MVLCVLTLLCPLSHTKPKTAEVRTVGNTSPWHSAAFWSFPSIFFLARGVLGDHGARHSRLQECLEGKSTQCAGSSVAVCKAEKHSTVAVPLSFSSHSIINPQFNPTHQIPVLRGKKPPPLENRQSLLLYQCYVYC